jgi:hypothetical protein
MPEKQYPLKTVKQAFAAGRYGFSKRASGGPFVVYCDDGTGKNGGHRYGSCRTREAAEEMANEAESLFPWCVGAFIRHEESYVMPYSHPPLR